MINIPIEIGDTILAGKFRNKKIVVKEIGVDLHGGPTVNGRPILQIRIPKLYKLPEGLTEMATKVKIKKDNGKFNIYRCTVDGDEEETPINKYPYETENHAITSAIYKGFDVGEKTPKGKELKPPKNDDVPRIKHEKPKEIELSKEQEVKLENYIRKVIVRQMKLQENKKKVLNELYTEKDLKFVDGKAVIKKGNKIVAKVIDHDFKFKKHNLNISSNYPYTVQVKGGTKECKNMQDCVNSLNRFLGENNKPFGNLYKPYTNAIREILSINEIDITDPDLEKKVQEYARLIDEMDRLSAQLKALEKQFKPLDEEFIQMIDAVDETKERVLRTQNILITVKKKGYEAKSPKYKEAFEMLYSKVNGTIKKMADECMTATTSIKKVSSSLAVQKLQGENKLNEAGILSNLWNKVKGFISKFTSKIKQQGQTIDQDLTKLEKLSTL